MQGFCISWSYISIFALYDYHYNNIKKKMKQVLFSILLALLPMAAEADDEGSCGDDLLYSYVEADKTLTISGSGAMTDYVVPGSWGNHVPWEDYKYEVEHIVIESGVTSIGDAAFFRFENLQMVEIPAGVTYIGQEAFHYCYKLTALTIPQSVESIGGLAFEGCSGLTSIVVEEGNAKYDSRDHCNALIETETNTLLWGCVATTFPEGIAHIARRAFYGTPIVSVELPRNVLSIGNEAFMGCGCLTSVTFSEGLTTIESSAFENCSGLTAVSLPNSVTTLNGAVFKNCTRLASVNIPNQLTAIQLHLFYNCSQLASVVIPESVEDIYDYAFYGCSGLNSMTCLNPEPPRCIGSNALDVDYTIPLYVPKGCVNKYKAADYWRNFVNIYEVGETAIRGIRQGDTSSNAPYYNLNGARTSHPGKGVYIQNGRKVVLHKK